MVRVSKIKAGGGRAVGVKGGNYIRASSWCIHVAIIVSTFCYDAKAETASIAVISRTVNFKIRRLLVTCNSFQWLQLQTPATASSSTSSWHACDILMQHKAPVTILPLTVPNDGT